MTLTEQQKAAISHSVGNLQLIACAGSGKTEVVARRVANLLKNGLLPRNIVAFTFTDKAAAELKERIVTRCREELGEIPGLAELYVGTIHAFCLEILKTEVPEYLKYEVLNEVQQLLFVDRHSTKCGLTTSTDLAGKPLRRFLDTKSFVEAMSILREADIVKQELEHCSLFGRLEDYEDLLDDKSYLDYSGILYKVVSELVNNQQLRERFSERIKHVIVDEYQDVNPIQEAIVRTLNELGASICVVGDDDQTIYQWRGSAVRNILTFEGRYSNVTPIKLEDNFRSSNGIVETARTFIAQNGERLEKEMKPTDAQGFEPGDIVALSFATPEEEAQYIVQGINSLRGIAFKEDDIERGLSWSDMAILLRSVRANAEPITRALGDAHIPYLVVGMNNLFSTQEAEAARQLFYFMASHNGVDADALQLAWEVAQTGSTPEEIHHAIESAASARKAMVTTDEQQFGFYSIQRQFLTFLEEAGIREERVPNGRGEILFYNLGKFSQLISDFETINYHSKPVEKYASFANFLEYRAEDSYPEGWQDNQYANPDAVRIMTVHQAKGMQWPVVFVPALLKNRFPSKQQGGRNVWHLIPAAGVQNQGRFRGGVEDERRLFYVAMTRSQKFLHMTWAPVQGNQLFQRASDFWNDILASKWVKRRPPDYSTRSRLAPQPKASVSNVVLSFSDLKYFFECPYQFKLRILLRLQRTDPRGSWIWEVPSRCTGRSTCAGDKQRLCYR